MLMRSVCAVFLSTAALAQAAGPTRPPFAPIQTSVLTPPTVFSGNGARYLSYEIQLTNWSTQPWTMQSVAVSSERAPLQEIVSKDIGALLGNPARKANHDAGQSSVLAAGESVIAYMWITLPENSPAPQQLRHHYTVTLENDPTPFEFDGPPTPVLTGLRTIGAPARGKNWYALSGPSNVSPHRRSVHVMDGVAHLSQRYAIDWEKETDDLKMSQGDPKDNRSYPSFGVEALAAADGVVVELKDGIPENVPHETPVVPITLDTVAGNHINLDFGDGVYAMYAHLQPGSLRVKPGDRVRRGQVLGLVGNTGNSTEPHLHFQLMSRDSPLDSEGLPYRITEFRVTRHQAGDREHPTVTVLPVPEIHRNEMPLDKQVVDFE